MTSTNGRSGRRVKPYSTGDVAREFGVSINTVIRLVNDGEFGPEGKGWRWTKAGPGRGERRIRASYVERYRERNT